MQNISLIINVHEDWLDSEALDKSADDLKGGYTCLVVMDNSFGCKILYFTPNSEHELADFYTTDLHTSLQTGD